MKVLRLFLCVVFVFCLSLPSFGGTSSYLRGAQGDILLLEVPDGKREVYLEKAIPGKRNKKIRRALVFERNGKYFALIPLALTDKPGEYFLTAYSPSGTRISSKKFFISHGSFQIHRSSRWNTGLSREALVTVNKERVEIARAYKDIVPSPLWLTGFAPAIRKSDYDFWSKNRGVAINWANKLGEITHSFGETRLNPKNKRRSSHFGADIRAPEGYPIRSIADGRVAHVGKDYLLEGNITIIDHGAGIYSLYLHQSEILVEIGDTVTKGQVIGKVGHTGNAIGPHLHLAVKVNGVLVDPIKLIELLK